MLNHRIGRDSARGVFANLAAVLLKYLLILRIRIDSHRVRRDLSRFHQGILRVMQNRGRLNVPDSISLIVSLIIGGVCMYSN